MPDQIDEKGTSGNGEREAEPEEAGREDAERPGLAREAAEREAAESDAAGRNAVGREAAGREAAGREAAGRKAAGREAAGREAAGREAAGREAAGREAAGRKAAGRNAPEPDAAQRNAAEPNAAEPNSAAQGAAGHVTEKPAAAEREEAVRADAGPERSGVPPLEIAEVRDRASFVALEREWDELVTATGDVAFFRHAFFRIWLDNFAPSVRLRILLARGEDGRLEAALPLVSKWTSFHGVPVRQLVAAANSHSCRFDLLARDPDRAGRAFLEALAADRSWDVLLLIDVPEQGSAFALFEAAKRAGLPSGRWSSQASPYVPLPSTVDELRARMHPKLRANCRRRRRKLEGLGPVSFERYLGGPDLDGKLEEGFALEAGGWKGERGTAMAQSPATRGFYSELARDQAHRGELVLSFLRVGGRPVAFHYALCHGGRYLLLKPGYDEGLSECSPGQLLMENVLTDCVERGLTELDFLGPDMPWKRDWADRTRAHSWLFVFRDTTFGRALCAAKFRWGPAAKGVWARWTGRKK